jgi:tetratricopeptide (TPR) repeat protein
MNIDEPSTGESPAEAISTAFAVARRYQEAGEFGRAREEYNRLLQADPNCVQALHGLGGIAYRLGEHDRAAEWLARAVALQPDNALLHSNLAAVYRLAGRFAEAEACCRQALRIQPDLAAACNNLGNALRDQGRRAEAEARYWQAVLASPGYAEARHNLGLILWERGGHTEALDHFRFAAQARPDFADAHLSCGLVLRELGRADEARVHLSEAIRLRPDWAEARQALAAIGRPEQSAAIPPLAPRLLPAREAAPFPSSGLTPGDADADAPDRPAAPVDGLPFASHRKLNPEEAEARCREALRLRPDLPRAQDALGAALARQGRLAEAIAAFYHALRVDPMFAAANLHLGAALREQGDLERAVGYLRHALRLRPQLAEAHNQLALALVDRGDLEAAADAYREALRLKPDSVFALSRLGALLEELAEPDKGKELLEQALRLGPDEAPAHAHYGASLVNQGRLEEARRHFLRALEIQPDCAAAWFSLAREGGRAFTTADISHIQNLLSSEHRLPRDRINLHFALARIHDRAGHFDEAFSNCEQGNACKARLLHLRGTAYREETHAAFVDRLIAAFGPAHFERTRTFGSSAEEPIFIVGMPRSGTSLVEQILASHPDVHGAGELRWMKQFADDLPAASGDGQYPECLAGLNAATARGLGARYIERLRRLGRGKPRITDKMPMNFHHLGLIATLWPRAPIIHCRRDARDVCWSCYFQNFRDVPFACDLRQLAAYHRQYERLMRHWRAVPPIPILDVCYEELTAEPERVSREIVAFCRLPWHDGCLEFHRTPRVVRTASNLQVRRPIYRTSVGYWRNYEQRLGPLLEALGPIEPV